MQEDGKIHIPARSKQPVDQQTVVKLSPEAYNVLVDIIMNLALSLKSDCKHFDCGVCQESRL